MDKVTICALTLGRTEMTRCTWANNLHNAGMDFDLLWFDNGSTEGDMRELFSIAAPYRITWFEWSKTNTGIAHALNSMIKVAFARGADHVVTMANDILEPDNWLRARVDAANAVDHTGVVAIPVKGARRYGRKLKNGFMIEEGQVIGNWLITRAAFEKVGLFFTGYGIYGPLDLDYSDRLEAAGLRRYYLSDLNADHIGTKEYNPEEYQRAKDESLAKAWNVYKENRKGYKLGKNIYQFE